MIDFWLPAALLLALAAAFVLAPLLYTRNTPQAAPADPDRNALNVASYHERLRDLETQHQAGVLDSAQLEAGRAEAARALLADTSNGQRGPTQGKKGLAAILVAALLVPLAGGAMYMHWGALDDVLLARQFAGHTGGQDIARMTAQLEASLAKSPDSAEGWFFLGRTYMVQNRYADAARAFERAAGLAGRPPEILGQWTQALYLAGNQQWSNQLQALTDEALAGDPAEPTSLTLAGMAAFESGRYADAASYWERLAATLPEDDPNRSAVADGIAQARALQASPHATPPQSQDSPQSQGIPQPQDAPAAP